MKILTVGNGFIASSLSYQIASDRLDINYESIKKFIDKYTPDVLINAIGYCGYPNIDACELDKKRTFDTNTVLPIMLATECAKRDIYFVNIGSGCIYNGLSPNHMYEGTTGTNGILYDFGWKETNAANPISTYSKSKYAADISLETMKNVVNLRIRMPISQKNDLRNLISKLISYKEVVEIPNSVSFVSDLSRAVAYSVDKGIVGTYHITSSRPITHSEILDEYIKYIPNHKYTKITSEKLDKLTTAKRSNCILDNSKILKEGFIFEDQDELLKDCVKKFALNKV